MTAYGAKLYGLFGSCVQRVSPISGKRLRLFALPCGAPPVGISGLTKSARAISSAIACPINLALLLLAAAIRCAFAVTRVPCVRVKNAVVTSTRRTKTPTTKIKAFARRSGLCICFMFIIRAPVY